MNKRLKIGFIYLTSLLFLFFHSCVKEPANPDNNNGTSDLPEKTIINVSYGSHSRQVYDIYLPKNRDSNTPVILMIHGGAWKGGQKEDFNYYLNLIRAKWQNVAIVNMNYRLASNVNNIHHNEIMDDISTVVKHITGKKSEYQISTKIGVVGASAGGQLAMIYAYKYNPEIKCVGNIFGPSIISDWSWYNSTNVWLGAYTGDILTEYVGQSWDTTAYKAVSPYWNVQSRTQPTIIFHGSLDPIVPVYQSQWMHGKLDKLGVKNQYHEYLAFHSFDNAQSDDVINKLITFFKEHL
jgi:acetyl esterase/lipase